MRKTFAAERRRVMKLLSVAGLAATAIGSAPFAHAQDGAWPSDTITIIVPFDAGGSADRMARTLAGPLGDELGVPVTVENRPGGAGGLGATFVARADPDGNTLLLMQATPYLANAILIGGAPVEWDDFRFLNAQWNDFAIVAVNKESDYTSLEQLIEAMKTPGEVSSGIIYANGGHLQTLMLMDSLDIPQDNVRFVTYDGGAPLRTALAGNQVDFEILAARGAAGIMENLNVLSVVNDSAPDDLDAPLLNDVVTGMGAPKQPIIGGNITGLLVPPAFEDDYPDRYETLVEAYRSVVESDAYGKAAEEAGVGHDWIGPEKSQALVDEAYQALSQYSDVVK